MSVESTIQFHCLHCGETWWELFLPTDIVSTSRYPAPGGMDIYLVRAEDSVISVVPCQRCGKGDKLIALESPPDSEDIVL